MSTFIEKNFPTLARTNKKNKFKVKKQHDKDSKKQSDAGAETSAADRKDYKPTVPALPYVNLLPPILLMLVKQRRLQFFFIVAGVTMIVISLLVSIFQQAAAEIGAGETKAVETKVAAQKAAAEKYGDFESYLTKIRERQTTAATIGDSSINYTTTYKSFDSALPKGGSYTSVTLEVNTAPPPDVEANKTFSEKCGQSTDPFASTETAIACVTLGGTAPSAAGVEQLIATLEKNAEFTNVYITQVATAAGGVTFQGNVRIVRTPQNLNPDQPERIRQ